MMVDKQSAIYRKKNIDCLKDTKLLMQYTNPDSDKVQGLSFKMVSYLDSVK